MFVVVVFFLIYGVEVFFKVRGGFTVPRVSSGVTISSTRTPIVKSSSAAAASEKPLLSELSEEMAKASAQQSQECTTPKRSRGVRGQRPSNGVIFSNDNQEVGVYCTLNEAYYMKLVYSLHK